MLQRTTGDYLALTLLTFCLLFVGAGLRPTPAQAGGYEYTAAGTRSLGRGGAFFSRADDPMALLYNPANLAVMPGTQLSLQVNQAFYSACYQRNFVDSGEGTDYVRTAGDRNFTVFDANPGPDSFPGQSWSSTPLAEVCQENLLGLSPQLGLTIRVHEKVGIGVGVVAPASMGAARFGDSDGSTVVNGTRVPSPARYNLIQENLLVAFPTVGIGVQVTDFLRIGAAFQWGIGSISSRNMVRPNVGEDPANDVMVDTTASDFFVPGFVVSAQISPIANLDVMLGFRWIDSIRGSGSLDLTHGFYGIGVEGVPVPSTISSERTVDNVNLTTGQPWTLSLGVRYADVIASSDDETGSEGAIQDSMQNERWDVEFDMVYEASSQVGAFVLSSPDGSLPFRSVDQNGAIAGGEISLPNVITIPHNWRDQFGFRLGGDYNIIPGQLAARAGASFETSGVEPAFAHLDFIPGMRLGLHVGATLRVGVFDLSLAYAHIFQWDIEVPRDVAATPQVDATQDRPGLDGRVINAGTYSVGFDVLSLGVNWHIE